MSAHHEPAPATDAESAAETPAPQSRRHRRRRRLRRRRVGVQDRGRGVHQALGEAACGQVGRQAQHDGLLVLTSQDPKVTQRRNVSPGASPAPPSKFCGMRIHARPRNTSPFTVLLVTWARSRSSRGKGRIQGCSPEGSPHPALS